MASYSLEGYRRANDVREFCRRHIVIPDGPGAGKHLVFEPWYWKNIILPISAPSTLTAGAATTRRSSAWPAGT